MGKILALFFVFISVVLLIVICVHESNGKLKEFLKKLFSFILYTVFILICIAIFIFLCLVFYKLFKNLIIAGIITAVISSLLLKLIDR